MSSIIPFINDDEIQVLVQKLAKQISKDYQDKNLLVVGILKGAVFFVADLVRQLTVPAQVDFVRVSSYGSDTKSSGKIRILKDVECDISQFDVLLVDEIIDTGLTLHVLRKKILDAGAKSVRVCCLVSKPARREVKGEVEYCGREVEDKFLVGYGLDFNEQYRNLKNIGILQNS